jgi:hypothetical protein
MDSSAPGEARAWINRLRYVYDDEKRRLFLRFVDGAHVR